MTSDHFIITRAEMDSPVIALRGREHHHLARVARIKVGTNVWLLDEEGTKCLARVESIGAQETRLRILGRKEIPVDGLHLSLAQSVLKAKGMDFVVQKSTELGVGTIIPLLTSRSVAKLDERAGKRQVRWQRIAREAAKQSKSSRVPRILPPRSLRDLVEERTDSVRLFLTESGGAALREIVANPPGVASGKRPDSALIVVGPEGGWTSEEEKLILEHGYTGVSLGPLVLRAETAALSTAAVISLFWNR